MAIWDRANETMDREALASLQLERLKATFARCCESVPFYRSRFDAAGMGPHDICSLDDLRRLPCTTKDDFRDSYPFGLFAVPQSAVVRIHSSSGTTGKPVVGGYTRADLEMCSELIARIVTAAGVTRDDVAQVSFGYGMFTGGFGLHYGLEKVGATVVPHSAGNTARQIQFMQDFGTTVLIATPSYALYIGEVVRDQGIDPAILRH